VDGKLTLLHSAYIQSTDASILPQYGYYTASALGYRVPIWFKRTLTTCQILQFVTGFSFAAAHLFVSYSVPVTTPYYVFSNVASAATAAAASAPSSVSSKLSSISPTATAQIASLLKKLAFRAAGEEGLAENVGRPSGQLEQAIVAEEQKIMERIQEVRYRNEFERVSCIDTDGESFAIWLNLIYLFPLTALFVRFFIRSYTSRMSKASRRDRSPVALRGRAVADASKEAFKRTDEQVEKMGTQAEDAVDDIGEAVKRDLAEVMGKGINNRSMQERIDALARSAKDMAAKDKQLVGKKMKQLAGDGSLDEKIKRAEDFIRESVKKATDAKTSKAAGKEDTNGVPVPQQKQESKIKQEEQAESSKDATENATQPATDGNGHSARDESRIKEEDKQSEDFDESQANGDTQPSSLGTSQTVSDLDGSYASVLKDGDHDKDETKGDGQQEK
jgi:hypothetical protein